ncbi:MAG: PHP-associated domain-containing protein, partial [Candidatus Methylomirabilales bacterium]
PPRVRRRPATQPGQERDGGVRGKRDEGFMGLKADLHLHTREGEAFIAYDARGLIDRAARDGFQVLSITNHNTVTFSDELAAYARERGILLIPGVEATIEGRHVLLYNLDVPPRHIQTFADLRRLRSREWLVVAAHPFFPGFTCLRRRLVKEIDLFDAIEFSHFYTRRIDFNRPAVRLAREIGLPLLGTSDSHLARQFGTTYSLIDGELTVASVLAAIRKGQVRVVSRPLRLRELVRIALELTLGRVSLAFRQPNLIRASCPRTLVVGGAEP